MISTSILLLVILILVIVALCSVLFLKRSNFTTRLNEQQRTAATVSNIFDIATSDNASNKNALDEKNSKVSVSKYEERAVENSFSNNNNDDDDSAAIVDIIPSSTKKKMKRIEKFPKSFYKLTNNDRNNTDSQDDYEYENDDKNYTYNENDGNSSDSSFHIGDYIGTLLTSTQPNNLLFKFDLNNIIENWDMDFNDSNTSDGGG
jgi:type II secretory pathway pseudopilin PulG